jgi:predicted nuclease of restriction endonuclease-like (RecB) superfamily
MAKAEILPNGYRELLDEIVHRIARSQVRAGLAVSRELILLYWSIGAEILLRQRVEGWGTKVIDRLGRDLQAHFPGVEGFSPRNLKYMRSLAEAWPDPQVVPQRVALLPWGHLRLLLDRVKDPEARDWYLAVAVREGWSRDAFGHMIGGQLHAREGKSLTNFSQTLPPENSEMAVQVLRDPYNFDFLTLAHPLEERKLERGLLAHMRDLLLELGRGFAFVGSQVPLTVWGGDLLPRSALLPRPAALLLRHRTQDRQVQARVRWQAELLPVSCGRHFQNPTGRSDDRPAAVRESRRCGS